MKIVDKNENGQGQEVIWFSTNRKELELILGMSETSLFHTPKTIDTTYIRGRLRNFIKEIRKI